jgi:uncharacterized protein involved in outer membrane biogenesis
MNDLAAKKETGKARKWSRVWRILKRAALTVVALLFLLLLLLAVFGGVIIKGVINRVGPAALGVPISVEHVTFRPIRGAVRLQGLHVGNPKGFKTPALFDLNEVMVQIDLRSLLRPPVHIKSILVKAPVITYELALGRSNIGALVDSLEGDKKEKEPVKKPAAKDSKGKVIIDELVIEGARVRLSATIFQGAAAGIPLPRIALHDIGKEKGGTSWLEATKSTLAAVGSAIGQALMGLGGTVVDGLKSLGSGIGSLFSGSSSNVVTTNAPVEGKEVPVPEPTP